MFALEFIQNYAKNRKSNRIFSDHIRELANPEENNSKENTNDGRFVLSDEYGAVFNEKQEQESHDLSQGRNATASQVPVRKSCF